MMIAHKKACDAEKRLETFASENRRLNSIAEKLQAERSQLQHQILGFEASTKALHVELQQRAAAEGKSVNTCKDFSQRLEAMRLQNSHLADLAGLPCPQPSAPSPSRLNRVSPIHVRVATFQEHIKSG